MHPSRRTLLQGAGAAGLAGAVALLFPSLAAAVPGLETEGFENLRRRWVDQLTGRDLYTPGDALFQDPITRLDEEAAEHLALLGPAGADPLFADLPWEREANLTAAIRRVTTIATAWATPGSRFHDDPGTRDRAVQALRDFRAATYHPDQPEYGNWWHWEIGVPRALADAMAILGDHLSQQDIDLLGASIDYYVPDPWEQFPASRGRQTSEGANRVDLCQGVIIRSIVGQDAPRLAHAVDGLTPVWQHVEGGNGFYEDGSFIQHGTIGYTGTYGLVLLAGLSKLFALLAGSPHDITDPSRENLTRAVEHSFAPFLHEGQMMDAVRGRAVSRETERSIDNGSTAIEAILRLADAADEQTAAHWRALCRGWIEDNAFTSILDGASIPRLARVNDLLTSDLAARRHAPGAHLFPAMDRLVYRGEGWSACVAMCSDRIAWYECGNGENDHGAQTSQGMTYLYLTGDDGHFDDEFWATSDLQGPPGTTVDATPLPPRVGGQWGSAVPENEWTGGAVLDEFALAGQHLVGPGGTGLTARKTWFFLPGAYVALGSDIGSDSGAEVRTVVEHRNLGAQSRQLLVDGGEVGADGTEIESPRWAHIEAVGGYVFLAPQHLRASCREREGSWSRNNAKGSDVLHHRVYATLESLHPEAASSYAYAVLPGADVSTTRAAADDPPVEVVRNDDAVQAVRAGQVLAANFWSPARVQGLTADDPLCLIRRGNGPDQRYAISDPTQRRDTVTVTIAGGAVRRAAGSDRVQVVAGRGELRVTVDVRGLAGVPVEFSLLR
ncbi:polysaccharide lyase 8 family protein [Brachybacterium vulturis]|uniref:polysaccharide lyase 8 family protein n=1 Tax=Brachybacterium vulturis TaxID=2017484 RepID=UPI00373646B9